MLPQAAHPDQDNPSDIQTVKKFLKNHTEQPQEFWDQQISKLNPKDKQNLLFNATNCRHSYKNLVHMF